MRKDLISISDLSRAEIRQLFRKADSLRNKRTKILDGKTLAMIFEKSSTRTRVSFEVAMYQLGGLPIFLPASQLQLGRGETIADTARTLSRYVDGIVIRANRHTDIVELARIASVPVINALSDLEHPCQVLGDLYTIYRRGKKMKNIKVAFVGDGNNMANSWLLLAARIGFHLTVASPEEYRPDGNIVQQALLEAKKTGCRIEITSLPKDAARNADVLYTDVWVSMGQESERENREKAFRNFQVNDALLKLAKPDAMVMHCLPAHRGQEISSSVMDGPHSIIFEQAENRLHIQKALLATLL